jgi:hypothetical protein
MNQKIIVLIIIIMISTSIGTTCLRENYQKITWDIAGNTITGNLNSGKVIYGNVITIGSNNQTGNTSTSSGNTSTSSLRYNQNNYNTLFHAEYPPYTNPDLAGNIVYYQPGSFIYGASSYVPYYEDTVFLTRSNKAIVNAHTHAVASA